MITMLEAMTLCLATCALCGVTVAMLIAAIDAHETHQREMGRR